MPFSPLDLSSLAGWYDADDASTFSYSSGSVVSQWRDKSGLNRHFAQASTSLQPVRNGTYNGRTTLVFDGTDDYMDTGAFTVPQPITVFFAMKPNSDLTQGWFSSVGGGLQFYYGGNQVIIYAGSSTRPIQNSLITTDAQYWTVEFNAAASKGYLNGTFLTTTATPGSSGTTTGWRLAERGLTAGYRLNGHLFEIIVYSRILTDPERTQVDDYLTAKWLTAPPTFDFTGWGFPV